MIRFLNISQTYGRNRALQGVSFDAATGFIHAIVGENGAGKSTLMKILAGLEAPSSGEFSVGPRTVAMVHQHFLQAEQVPVWKHIAWELKKIFFRKGSIREAFLPIFEKLQGSRRGSLKTFESRIEELDVTTRQRIELTKALLHDDEIIVLDEPTAVLPPPEHASVMRFMGECKDRGQTLFWVTHKLVDVFARADFVHVLRHGKLVHSGAVSDTTQSAIAAAMLGVLENELPVMDVPQGVSLPSVSDSPERVVTIQDLVLRVGRAKISLELRPGEIVGIAGVQGSGQQELFQAIHKGSPGVHMDPALVTAFLPEDRLADGVLPDWTLLEHLALVTFHDDPATKSLVSIETVIHKYDVRGALPGTPLRALSGGNQQKFLLGLQMERKPKLMVVSNPTRGVDFHAADTLHKALRGAAQAGAAVLFFSTDLDEVEDLSHRFHVLFDFSLSPAFFPRKTSRETVARAFSGVTEGGDSL